MPHIEFQLRSNWGPAFERLSLRNW